MLTREMKDSGINWAGNIPSKWEVTRIKNVLTERKIKNSPIKTDIILSLLKDKGVIPYNEKGDVGNKSKQDITKYKVAYVDDIVMNSMNVIIGSVNISKYKGAVSPVYHVLYNKDNNKNNIEFINLIFQTTEFQKGLTGVGNGILEHRMRIPMNKLNDILIPLPPKNTQNKIVTILYNMQDKIEKLQKDTKNSIDELKKYKQSIITEAVTKGLDPNVEMKDSKIDWITEIPVHWKTVKGKYLFNKMEREILIDETVTVFRDGQVIQRRKRRTGGFTNSLKEIGYQGVKKGDLVIHSMDAFAGAIGISEDDGKCSPVCIVLNSPDNIHNPYFSYLLRSYSIFGYIESMATGIRVRSSDFRYSTFAVTPIIVPSFEEQQEIVNYIENKISTVDKLIEDKTKLLEELENYKKSLIYEYVTGKKEV